MILHIARRELTTLFTSPLAWVILAVCQMILAWVFFTQIDSFFSIQERLATMTNAPGVTDIVIAPLLELSSIILLMVTPLLTMRLISEERRNGTLELLFSAPISATEIVLGKFLGIAAFMVIFVSMISLMPLSLLFGTELDLGKFVSGLLGLTLMLFAFCAAGLYISSLTSNPSIAAFGSFGLLMMFWIIDRGADSESIIDHFAMTQHLSPMIRGIINSSDVIYFLLFINLFLVLTVRQLDAQRLQD